MMVLTVIVVAIFKTTVQLGNAYGNVHKYYIVSLSCLQAASACWLAVGLAGCVTMPRTPAANVSQYYKPNCTSDLFFI